MEKTDLQALEEHLRQHLKDDLLALTCSLEELTIHLSPEVLLKTLTVLKEHPDFLFVQLSDLCGVDYLTMGRHPRFELVYHLLSLKHNRRIRVKIAVDETDTVASVHGLYPCAGWLEREVFDLFGIPFSDHPDLRRILTDYGFEGHPLRKDFPLTGYVETVYDPQKQAVVYQPVELPQAFRTFDTLSPWEGMGRILEQEPDVHPHPPSQEPTRTGKA